MDGTALIVLSGDVGLLRLVNLDGRFQIVT